MPYDTDWLDFSDVPFAGIPTPLEVVLRARGCGPEGSLARNQLAELYQGAVVLMILAMVKSAEEARDLSQGFMILFLEGSLFTKYEQTKGSFRTWLKVWIRTYVRTERDKERVRRTKSLEGYDVADEREEPGDGVLDSRLTEFLVTKARENTVRSLGEDSLAWKVLDYWSFQRDLDVIVTQPQAGEAMGLGRNAFLGALRTGRYRLKQELTKLISSGVSTEEQFAEEVAQIRADLDLEMYRKWSGKRGGA